MTTTAEYLAAMDDAALIAWSKTAQDDLMEAANTQHESEWHIICFVAVMTLHSECERRGLDLRTLN